MADLDHKALHAHLLDLLGAKDHKDAARIIGEHHARELREQAKDAQGEALNYTPGKLDRTAPARIWLQIDTMASSDDRDDPWPGPFDVTWQDEPVGGLEIQYIRADTAPLAAVPDGWKLVPIEPTDAMLRVNDVRPLTLGNPANSRVQEWRAALYKAMVAAAPSDGADHG